MNNLTEAIATKDFTKQTRVMRYDVAFGRPFKAITYKRYVLSKVPNLYYALGDLDNLGTTGSTNDLAMTGTVTFSDGYVDATDSAASFDGSASYLQDTTVTTYQPTVLATRGVTVGVWVKVPAVVSGSNKMCVASYGSGNANHGFSIVVQNNGSGANVVKVYLSNSVVFTSNTILNAGWTFIAFTLKATGANYDFKMYQNGDIVASGTGSNYVGWTAGTDATLFRIGKNPPPFTNPVNFNGYIDEFGLWYITMAQQDIKKIYSLGINSTYIEPDEDFERDTIGILSQSKAYGGLILADNPVNYWNMSGKTVAGPDTYIIDKGTAAPGYTSNLYIFGYAKTHDSSTLISVKNNDPYCLTFSNTLNRGVYGTSYAKTLSEVTLGPHGTKADFTVEFWYNSRAKSRDDDTILGWGTDNSGGSSFVQVRTKENKLVLNVAGSQRIETDAVFLVNETKHVVINYDKTSNQITIYVNGNLLKTAEITVGDLHYPNTGYKFYVADMGHIGGRDHQGFDLGHVAVYNYKLTTTQIQKHYNVGLLGPYYALTLDGGDPALGSSPYQLSSNEYSTLTNQQDVSEYVTNYGFTQDYKQLVTNGNLTVKEPWGSNQIPDLFKANTYITIEQRYTADSILYDSGWLSVGHFLSEGPTANSASGQGDVNTNVAIKSPLKLLSLDICKSKYEPDSLFVNKTRMDVVTANADFTTYQKSHHLGNGLVYANWKELPTVKMWASNFSNLSAEESKLGGASYTNEQIRIKGTQGSVQVLGGAGSIVVDNDYLTAPISQDGLGNPGDVFAEFYRYAQSYDIETSSITNISFSNYWYTTVDSLDSNAHNKTVFVKSGNAKGKIFKVKQMGQSAANTKGARFRTPTNSNVALAGSVLAGWTYYAPGADPLGLYSGYLWRCTGTMDATTVTKYSNYLKLGDFSSLLSAFDGVPDTALVKGFKIILNYRTNRGSYIELNPANLPIQDHAAYLSMTGGLATTDVYSRNLAGLGRWVDKTTYPPAQGTFTRDMTWDMQFGGELDTLGFENLTVAQLKTYLSTMAFYYSIKNPNTNATYNGNTFYADITFAGIDVTCEWLPNLTLTDTYGNTIHPEYEGLMAGDVLQLGNFNAVEDVYRMILLESGFQEADPNLPFYFQLDSCPRNLTPSCPPLRQKLSDNKSYLDVVQGVETDFAPPDYRLYVDENGVVRGKLIGFNYLQGSDIVIPPDATVDFNSDTSDVNIVTRVIVEGGNGVSTNIGLNNAVGGFSSVHAYKLNHYATTNAKELDGQTLTQSAANVILAQVFDGSAKTPVPPTGSDWLVDGTNKYYGLMLNRYGPRNSVKRWDFEDQDLCAVDIGRSGNGTAIDVDYMEIVGFDHFFGAEAKIQETIMIYYMTEDDYEAEFSKKAPGTPNQTDTSYFPPSNSVSWKLLVDEIAINNEVRISEADFATGASVKARFFKFRITQCQYRFPIVGVDTNVISRFNLASVRIYNSSKIMSAAELGVDGEFETIAYKQLGTRLRRRSEFLSGNVLLNSYEKTHDFALNELKERINDYTPLSIGTIYPNIQLYQAIYWTNPKTLARGKYLVMSVNAMLRGVNKLQLINYDGVVL